MRFGTGLVRLTSLRVTASGNKLPSMRFPFSLLGLSSTQVAFKSGIQTSSRMAPSRFQNSNFALKEGADIFSPKNLVELGRPGTGVANEPGDLVLVPYSKYSFKDKK